MMIDMASQTDQVGQLFTSELLDNDPRFALWAARQAGDEDAIVLCSRHGEEHEDVARVASSSSSSSSPSSPLRQAQRAVPWMAGQQRQKRSSNRASVSSSDTGSASGNASNRSSKGRSVSTNASSTTAEESQHSILFPTHGPFLIAASMPTIVAELTSHIDNRFMTDFFYTYRAYVSSHDLLRFLIARFHWTLSPGKTNAEGVDDEAKRNIVRVRTYVVLKYWLTNFFTMDFLPNRALRVQFTDWLNGFSRVSAAQERQSVAGLGIIKSLKKIVRNLKSAYESTGIGGLLLADESNTPRMLSESNSHPEGLDETEGQDACVSLDLGDEGSEDGTSPISTRSPNVDSNGKPIITSPSPSASTHQRSRPSHTVTSVGPQHAPPPLPTSHSALSRAFVNTFSRISRIKRHWNVRASTNPFLGEGIDGADYDTNNCGDLLFMRGGLEGFLDFYELRTPLYTSTSGKVSDGNDAIEANGGRDDFQDQGASDGATARDDETPSLSSNQTRSTPASSFDLSNHSPVTNDAKASFGLGISDGADVDGEEAGDEDFSDVDHFVGLAISRDDVMLAPPFDRSSGPSSDLLHHFQSDQTLRSASRARENPTGMRLESSPKRDEMSFTSAIQTGNGAGPSQSNVVLIDDVDLSSDEDDGMVRRALRRLPAARNLRTAQNVTQLEAPIRQSFDSESSFGRVYANSRRSLASYFENEVADDAAAIAAHKTSIVTSEMLDPDEALRGFELVKGFRLEHLEDSDDEEPGDVEAALRRLEGVIDEDKERERARKVENMWQRSQFTQQHGEAKRPAEQGEEVLRPKTLSYAGSISQRLVESRKEKHCDTLTPSPSNGTIVVHSKERKSDEAESQQGGKAAAHQSASPNAPLRLPRSVWAPPPIHRSFLLDFRSDVIAQQFSLIEAELFRSVAWQELVSGQWKTKQHPGPVNDWESFYQARARNRVRAQKQGNASSELALESSVEAITARFRLTCNWVASEVVLTNSIEARASVVRKLIRIAWKCYHYSNFATLTQIILGLQSASVERLTKTWARVGVLEMRMLRDLKAFINPAGNFKHLRNAMRDMMIQGHMEDLIISSGPPQGGGAGKGGSSTARSGIAPKDGCIPFFGLFLSDLAIHDTLPTFVDPSSPDAEVDIEPSTGYLLRLAKPDTFDQLPSLPEGVRLSPLVNLYKYRILAMTVKSVLALQERLDAFNFPINRGVYVKSLKLRCLEPAQLKTISQMAE